MTRVFCTLCSKPYHLTVAKKLRPVDFARMAITTFLVSIALAPFIEWKGIVSVIPIWIFYEAAMRFKKRQEVICPHCGFDPILFRRDRKKAKKRVQEFWEVKIAEKEERKRKREEEANPESDSEQSAPSKQRPEGEDIEMQEAANDATAPADPNAPNPGIFG